MGVVVVVVVVDGDAGGGLYCLRTGARAHLSSFLPGPGFERKFLTAGEGPRSLGLGKNCGAWRGGPISCRGLMAVYQTQ